MVSPQVFHLSILPGTAFRRQAAELGLAYQDRPPYAVLQTPALSLEQMAMLVEEAQSAFSTEFDPLPPPALEFASRTIRSDATWSADRPLAVLDVDLDRGPHDLPPGERWAQALTLWLRAADFHRQRQAAARLVEHVLDRAPHTTLQVVLEPAGQFTRVTAECLSLLLAACYRTASYLDRFYSVQPGRLRGAKRLVVLAPPAARKSSRWRQAVEEYATLAWRKDSPLAQAFSP